MKFFIYNLICMLHYHYYRHALFLCILVLQSLGLFGSGPESLLLCQILIFLALVFVQVESGPLLLSAVTLYLELVFELSNIHQKYNLLAKLTSG